MALVVVVAFGLNSSVTNVFIGIHIRLPNLGRLRLFSPSRTARVAPSVILIYQSLPPVSQIQLIALVHQYLLAMQLSGGVTVKLCRRLVVSQDRNSVEAPTQIVCTTTLRGPEYEFPAVPGQAKTVNLRCPLPAISEADKDQRSSNDAVECFTARGMKLFTIQVFLRVELELGALSLVPFRVISRIRMY